MMCYIKDWRIWVLAIIILLIIRFPISGEEMKVELAKKRIDNVEPVKKLSDNIKFKFNDVEFKWKMNQFDTKWNVNNRFNACHKFKADNINEYRTMVLFTLEFQCVRKNNLSQDY